MSKDNVTKIRVKPEDVTLGSEQTQARENHHEGMHQIVGQMRKGMQRQAAMMQYLSGEKPWSEEEQQLASGFGGPHKDSFAQQSVSYRRKTALFKELNATDENDLLSKMKKQAVRARRFHSWLSGKDDENTDQ